MSGVTTYAPPVKDTTPVVVTGNTWNFVPDISLAGQIRELNVTHAGLSGLLAIRGQPLVQPVVWRGAQRESLRATAVTYIGGWIPVFHYHGSDFQAWLTVLTPPDEQGLMLELRVDGPPELRAALEFAAETLVLQRFREQELAAERTEWFDAWTGSRVTEFRAPLPLVALAVRGENGSTWDNAGLIQQERCVAYVGVARDADGARTTSVHLARLGFTETLERSRLQLERLSAAFPALGQRHALFNYFGTCGDEIDGVGRPLMTSRSPRYYVAGAFWARDALLWSFPATLHTSSHEAAERLHTAFERYTRSPGEHAQYLDGRPLYPGFELDEAAAFPWAIALYTKTTGDSSLLREPAVRLGLDRVARRIAQMSHPSGLYRTMLGPTDDPVRFPLLTYDNALLACAWEELAEVEGDRNLAQAARQLRAAIVQHCISPGPHGPQFAWSTDGQGQTELGDEPAGSLSLLARLGCVSQDDPVFKSTIRWIRHDNPYSYAGPYGAEGSAHFPHPSCFSIANMLVRGEWDVGIGLLQRAPLDGALACEGFDLKTGVVTTGAGFAACSGLLAASLLR